MKRFLLLLANEFRLARTAIPIHVVVILQPAVMFLLMSAILVYPTFDMNVTRPVDEQGWTLVAAMEEVGSPIGLPYIHPVLVDEGAAGMLQVVTVEDRNGIPTAVQRFGLVDSNVVKNYRNRLTAAGLIMWNDALGNDAVMVEERPWLPRDMPFALYFGMALLPMTVALSASVLGGVLTAQEFEFRTILEYRLAPTSVAAILGARLTRLVLSGLLSAAILLVAVGVVTKGWPGSLWLVGLILLPVGIITGSLGIIVGLLLQKTIPAFLVGLVVSFVAWIMGSAFGLAAGFNRGYEMISRLTPNTHAVELLFPTYFGMTVGNPLVSALVLICMSVGMSALATLVYRQRVLRRR
jgi:hypothetical protein